eukprot:scaffold252952_cov13-Tisochrysis_lutea.AAC.1
MAAGLPCLPPPSAAGCCGVPQSPRCVQRSRRGCVGALPGKKRGKGCMQALVALPGCAAGA